MAKKSEANKGVVTSERIKKVEKKQEPTKSNEIVEVELLKDHGLDKKGDKIKRPRGTADVLIIKKIAK